MTGFSAESFALYSSPTLTFAVEYNRSYHHSACKAYNIVRHVVDALRMDDAVFATAMSYWHEFVSQHGCRKIDEIVLAAAAVFLAGKVEHYKLRVDQVLKLALEVDVKNMNSEEVGAWRRMLLEVELLLSDSLHFDFQRQLPINQMLALLKTPRDPSAQRKAAADAELVRKLQKAVHCLYLISLISPLCVKVSSQHIAATILYMAIFYSGNQELYSHIWQHCPLPDAAMRDAMMGVVMDAFAFSRKQTGIPLLDEKIAARHKRLRNEPPASFEALRSSLVHSSSVGSESVEPSPMARPID